MEDRDLTEQADFYRWLRSRNEAESTERVAPRVQLEIPEPPMYQVPAKPVERGIYIIEF